MTDPTDYRQNADRKLLTIFLVLFLALSVILTVVFVAFNGGTVSMYVGGMEAVVTFAFFGCGVYSFKKYRKESLIPKKRINGWILKGSLVLAAMGTVVLFILFEFFPSLVESQGFPDSLQATVALIAIFLALFLAFLLAIMFELMIAFGAIGTMSAVERRIAPRVLRDVSNLGDKQRLSASDYLIRWLFAIPDVVDTKLLDVHPEPKRPIMKWRDMIRPLEWQLLFGAVLAMYVSLNPIIAGSSGETLTSVFDLLSSGAIIIPVVILPWFALQRLGAGIGGGKKEFTLYNGIRSRLIQTFFAIGTLLLLVRVLVSGTNVEAFVAGFSSFMVILALNSILNTFVYLNFFENDLVEDIASGFGSDGPESKTSSDAPLAEAKSA